MASAQEAEINRIIAQLDSLVAAAVIPPTPINDYYSFSYRAHLAQFAHYTSTSEWSMQTVVACFSMVYGWMPRGIQSYDPRAIATLANLLHAGGTAEELVQTAAQCMNNSIVAGSKFLHWVQPDVFPMFDSHIERLLWPTTSSRLAYRRQAQGRYYLYREALLRCSDQTGSMAMLWAGHHFGYPTGRLRALEALLFYRARTASQ